MCNKIFKKINFLVILIGLFLVFVSINSTNAQQNLAIGGDSFETAAAIQPGNYQVGSLEEGKYLFYSFSGKAGQLVKIRWNGYAGVTLYDADKEIIGNETGYSVGSKYENIWLPNSTKDNYTYYLKVFNDIFSELDPFTLELSLLDYYDANSKTDAGDTFNEALEIVSGDYQGHLSAEYINSYGTDNVDYYKILVKKGVTYEFKVSPPISGLAEVEILNQKRELLDSDYSSNDGGIVSMFLTPVIDSTIFLSIKGNNYDDSYISFDYDLSVKISDSLNKFYICQDGYCEFAGEYASIKDCQEENVKTCYLSSDCDGNCEDIISGGSTESLLDELDEEDMALGMGSIVPGLMEGLPDETSSFLKSLWKWAALYFVLLLVFYIYFAICLQTIAQKTNTPNSWLAWIPIANIFLFIQIAQKPLWWFVLLFIPIVNIIIGIILWMEIAEKRGKPNWLGILIIVPIIGLIIPGYLAFSDKKKIEKIPVYSGTGTKEANKPTVGYKHSCKYCGKLIPPNSTTCPFCGKINPLGPERCPRCHEPIEKDWKVCAKCNQNLRIVCPYCGKITFFGDHCEDCGKRLIVKCPSCGQEQPPISDNCIKCGQPLKI